MGKSGEEVFVDGVAFAIDALLLGHLVFETAALFGRVGKFAEPIRQFDAAHVEFEAFGDARVVRAAAGEGGFDARVFVEDCRAIQAQMRLDAFRQHAAEDVGPGIVAGHGNADAYRLRDEGGAVASLRCQRRQ